MQPCADYEKRATRNHKAMNDTTTLKQAGGTAVAGRAATGKPAVTLSEHVVEIVSDSGEGAQRCGQSFGAIAARMGNGIWTVEIIPAEIQPPARSIAGASRDRWLLRT